MGTTTNINQVRLAMAINEGLPKTIARMALKQAGVLQEAQVAYIGDTSNVPTFGALEAASLANRRETDFHAQTLSDEVGTFTSYSMNEILTVPLKVMDQINGPLVDAMVRNGASVQESVLADLIIQTILKPIDDLLIHTLVKRAIDSSMVFDITGKTAPADKITSSTHASFRSGVRWKYSDAAPPPCKLYVTSIEGSKSFEEILDQNGRPVYAVGANETVEIAGTPLIVHNRVDADLGVLEDAYGTISTDTTAKHRFLRLSEGAIWLFSTTTADRLASSLKLIPVGNADTDGKGPGIQISVCIELAAFAPANLQMQAQGGVSMGLFHANT